MKVKLEDSNSPTSVTPKNMRDGDIGEIVKWTVGDYIGTIVQKYGDTLISVGRPKGDGWSNATYDDITKYQIRILQKGEKIVID